MNKHCSDVPVSWRVGLLFQRELEDRIGGRQKIILCFMAGAILYAVGAVIVY